MRYRELRDLEGTGVEIINDFADQAEISSVLQEANDPERVQWLDAHEVYKNNRGLTIIQNHFTFALKLSEGDQSGSGSTSRNSRLKRTYSAIH